ncbi:MAG: hypothetical protein AW08_03181 [Candidatus Accumulibacter adjunctus]|uniref:Uncharacterized protein n=1 Tax=Candidatus Accumulibacter adjunctus TaxID=1454001 RepID=A0A011NM87_9PROT|nr:MAG: hypothetical protein AW08_03181 [Candidatus Accumulibacter adjunctus]
MQAHPPGRDRDRQRLFQRDAPLFLLPALVHLAFQVGRQFELDTEDADQDQHESAQQPGHQVAEDGPYGSDLLDTGVRVVHQSGFSPLTGGCSPSWRNSATTFSCAMIDRSMSSRACAT